MIESKRVIKRGFFLVLSLFAISFLFAQEIETSADIRNTGPFLIALIPNQTWPSNQSLSLIFDLDNYFIDPNGDLLSFWNSSVENITVTIDPLNRVSFYPGPGFIGVRNVTFYASDGNENASSNLVFLNVIIDTEPPKWISYAKSKIRIYQNDYVNFTALWTDNFYLNSFIFSIDQGFGWTNYTSNFTGTANSSRQRVQISAGGGSLVYWQFCAYDFSGNSNCTPISSFNVTPFPIPPEGGEEARGGGGGGGGIGESFYEGQIKLRSINFSIEPVSFKISLKQGSTETRILKISNLGNTNLSFNLLIFGLEDFITLSEANFTIPFGSTKDITLDFTAFEDTVPDQYFGRILVNSSISKTIPVVIEVNSFETALDVDVSIFNESRIVSPGDTIRANITIKNIKDVKKREINLYIALKDFFGNIYDSNIEIVTLDDVLYLERNLTLPPDSRSKEYLFYARVWDDKNLAIDSDVFETWKEVSFLSSLKSSFIFILIFFLSIFALLLMMIYSREKSRERILSLYLMLNELKNLIDQGEFERAIDLYIRIKSAYGEPVSKEAISNRQKLREGIEELSKKLKKDIIPKEEGNKRAEKIGTSQEATTPESAEKKDEKTPESSTVLEGNEDEDKKDSKQES